MDDILTSTASRSEITIFSDDPVFKTVDEVELIPESMVFANAYDGKEFECKLVIRNAGKRIAFIRMCPPSSEAFRVKTIERGCFLASGLRIERKVSFTYTTPLGISHAHMPICINNTWINYKFFVTLSAAVITIEPPHLDFGRVDADHTATMRTLHLRNDGHKGTNFAIDLGRNPLEIIVDPMKGTVPAKASISLRVELRGLKQGDFAQDIWIKTCRLIRVVVSGTFIAPSLKVRDFQSTLQFSLIDFPRTYFGARITKPLDIHNYSSSNSIFYVMAEVQGGTTSLEKARELNDAYNHVVIHPYDGRMYADKASVVQITFRPIRPRKKIYKKYICCFLKIIRMNCSDITPGVFDDLAGPPDGRTIRESTLMLQPSGSGRSNVFDSVSLAEEEDDYVDPFTRICLHGEMEDAKIFIRPDLVVLKDLELSKVYERELFIENLSSHLPIIVKYVKVPSIDVFPNQFELKARGTIEIKLVIRTSKLGMSDTCVHFDLLFYDIPRDVYVLRKVGSECVKVQFYAGNVTRVDRMKKCCFIMDPDKIPKLDYEQKFKLSDAEFVRKYENRIYYKNFLRKNRNKPPINEELQDYDLTNTKLLMAENMKIGDCVTPEVIKRFSVFIPLAPKQLYNIKIHPRYFKLRKAAAFTQISETFTIENLNEFPVRFYFKPSKLCMSFPNAARVVIPAKQKQKIPFIFSSFNNGKYYVTIDVIVNESHVFQIATLAQVVPKTIYLDTTDIHFGDKDENTKFIKLENRINSNVGFEWELPESCFDIYPIKGNVPPERSMFCMISYRPDPTQADSIECTIESESGIKTLVQISHKKTTMNAAFTDSLLNVGRIPLNREVVKTATLQNFGNDPIAFNVLEERSLEGMEITPTSGILPGKGSQIFQIRFLIKAVIKFKKEISVDLQQKKTVSLVIEGEVDFPKIAITPEFMKFRKIYVCSYSRLVFQIVNVSNCEIVVTFNLEDYPEFTISSDQDNHLPHINEFALEAGAARVLFLHCRPLNVSTYGLYLPIILNGILGPSSINDNQSTNPKYFLQSFEEVYRSSQGVEIVKLDSQKLSLTKVNCYATNKAVSFSSLQIELQVFGQDHYDNKNTDIFDIINETDQTLELCIRTDDLKHPFVLLPENVDDFETYALSYVFKIQPESKATFVVNFEPDSPGEYFMKMPIFIRSHDHQPIFNYLRVEGVYKAPSIIPRTKIIYFEPVPRNIVNIHCLELELSKHFDECAISFNSEDENLNAVLPEVRNVRSGPILVNIFFSSSVDCCLNSKVEFECSCGGNCEVFVKGVVENCVLTCHEVMNSLKIFEFSSEPLVGKSEDRLSLSADGLSNTNLYGKFENLNENSFPFFPKDEDSSDYAHRLRNAVKTFENWIFTQGFFSKIFLKIPDDFLNIPRPTEPEDKKGPRIFGRKNEPKNCDLRLVELIINLTGHSVRKELITTQLPNKEDDLETMTFIYTTNLNVINFLTSLDAFIPHVTPESLLSYDHFVLYKKVKNEPPEITREEFYRFSKQCWVDLFAQLIKVLIFFRMNALKYSIPSLMKLNRSKTSYFQLVHGRDEAYVHCGLYHRLEHIVMEWINKHLQKAQSQIWTLTPVPHKSLTHFDDDLKDGVIFGAITASYCPYVIHLIEEMFVPPENAEEIFHNACCLIQTWRLLGISYDISPEKIANPNNLEMLLLSLYLFEVLPNFAPRETVTMEAPLSKKTKAEITLMNSGEIAIVYKVTFFNNQEGCFIFDQDAVKVPPKETVKLKVTYFAKRFHRTWAVLLFNGERPGQKFGTTVAFELLGVPDVSCSVEMAIPLKMYQPQDITIEIQSPYKGEVAYSAYIGYRPAFNVDELIPIQSLLSEKLPAMFLFNDQVRKADKDGKFQKVPFINCIVQGTYNVYAYYSNSELGDFGVKFSFIGVPSKDKYETIEIFLSKDFKTGKCGCKGNMFHVYCSKLVEVPIPCRNQMWWKSRKIMLLKNLKPSEVAFWDELLITPAGPRILDLIQSTVSHDFSAFLSPWQTVYHVTSDPKCPFIARKTLDIPDVTSEENVPLLIHAIGDDLIGKSGRIKLESGCGKEVRQYKVIFK